MKTVQVHLAAITRVTFDCAVEVPDDFQDWDQLADDVYDAADGSEFVEDNQYWEKGTCYSNGKPTSEKPAFRLEDGTLQPVEEAADKSIEPS